MRELSPAITRQYIDAVAVFDALAEATEEAAQVRGGMYWHAGPASSPESKYLVRTSPAGAQTSLGPRTPETQAIYDKFMQRKQASAERLSTQLARVDRLCVAGCPVAPSPSVPSSGSWLSPAAAPAAVRPLKRWRPARA